MRPLQHMRASPAAGVITPAFWSLVLAPQVAPGELLSPAAPLAPVVALDLLVATALSAGWMYLLHRLLGHQGPRSPLPWRVALAHLPLHALWWPVIAGPAPGWPRVWVPLMVAVTVCAVAVASGRGPRLWRPAGAAAVLAGAAVLTARPLAGQPLDRSFSAVGAACWGVVLMVALIGWGSWLARRLGARGLDLGQRLALGMAWSVVVGGLLNLVWSISHSTVLLFVGTGVILEATDRFRLRASAPGATIPARRTGVDPVAFLLAVAVTSLVGLQYVGAIGGTVDTVAATPAFDLHDDHQAYLVLPEKMLRLGSLGSEPFEARRALSMGGQSFLQTLVLVVLPLRTLHLLDGGIALVALVLLAAGGARRRGLGGLAALTAVMVALGTPHPLMRGNTSALLTGAVLLLAWFRLLDEEVLTERPSPGNAALIAVHAAGACAIKSTLIPAAVAMLLVSSAVVLWRSADRRGRSRETLATLALVGLALLPWMASTYASSATALYPILGAGFLGPGAPLDLAALVPDRGPLSHTPQAHLLAIGRSAGLLAPMLPLLWVRWPGRRGSVAAVAAAGLGTAVVLALVADPHLSRSLSRYAYPVVTAGLLATLLSCFDRRSTVARTRPSTPAVAAGLVSCTLLLVAWDVAEVYRRAATGVETAAAGLPVVSAPDRHAAAQLERALPPGAVLLETMPHPFLLDPLRQRVLLMSLPAASSLPPGLPLTDGSERLAEYLLSHSIRNLAHGGIDELGDLLTLTETDIEAAYPRSSTRWLMLRSHQRYRELVTELAHSRRRLYADRSTVLLDLATPTGTVSDPPDQ